MLPFCEVQLPEKFHPAQKKEKRRRAIWFVVRVKVKPNSILFFPSPTPLSPSLLLIFSIHHSLNTLLYQTSSGVAIVQVLHHEHIITN